MSVNRRKFIGSAALTAAAVKTLPAFSAVMPQASSTAGAKAYGSGYFGHWIEDEFGLPAFAYTCDQIKDPKAVTQVNPGIFLRPNTFTRSAMIGLLRSRPTTDMCGCGRMKARRSS